MKSSVGKTLATAFATGRATRAARAAALLLSLLLPGTTRAQHECLAYEPTEAGEVINNNWQEPFEVDSYQFTVPADPGGGYVIARMQTMEPSGPGLRIIPPSGAGTVSQFAPDTTGPSPYTLEVAFEVDAGSTFDVEVLESVGSSREDFPVPYTWSWTFVSRVDCYEENDGRPDSWPDPTTTSKTVPVDQVLEAYSLAGHLNFTIQASQTHNYDWYKFTLDDPTEIRVATLTTPLDQALRILLFNSDPRILGDRVPQVGQTGFVGPRLLEPGTYYIAIYSTVRGEKDVTLSEGEAIPDHFDRPYHFIVSTIDPEFVGLNGASFVAEHGLASDSWVSLFGGRIMGTLQVDSELPETLGDFTVVITDSAGAVHNARIYVVANGQLNILLPPGMAAGPATLKVWKTDQLVSVETIQIVEVSPGIFSAASNGMGVAAAVFQLIGPGETRTDGLTFDGNLAAVPLDLGPDGAELYVSLFATGMRNFSGEVTVTVDGMPVPFSGPVAQGEFDGLDQINIGPLPRSLAGRGEVEIVITVDGKMANVVTVAFQ